MSDANDLISLFSGFDLILKAVPAESALNGSETELPQPLISTDIRVRKTASRALLVHLTPLHISSVK